MTSLSLAEARRIALGAQGFDRPRPARPGLAAARGVIERLGLVQLDFVNVLAPAHYLVLYSRLGPYDRAHLDRLIRPGGGFTEQWAHEASIIPVSAWPLLRHRMARFRVRPYNLEPWVRENAAYADAVLDAVRERGPLLPEVIDAPEGLERKLDHTWFRSVPKIVLETHFGDGRIASAGRMPNFARLYDLAERVIPAEHCGREVAEDDARRELVRLAARASGVATIGDLADYYRMRPADVRPRVAELVQAGELHEVRVEGWKETAYLDRGARVPRRIDARALLSPFDPVVWTRPRAARLFGFDYRIEIYTPAERRKFGYYVLPFLLADRLVARVDLKADRRASRLRVLAAYAEAGVDRETAAAGLAIELRDMAGWLGLEAVEVSRRGDLAAMVGKMSA